MSTSMLGHSSGPQRGTGNGRLSLCRALSGLMIAATLCVSAKAQEHIPAVGFQQQRAESASYLPTSFAEEFAEQSEDQNHHDGQHGVSENPAGQHGSGHGDSGGHHRAGHGTHHLTLPLMLGSYSRGAGSNNVLFPIDRLLVLPAGLEVPALGAGMDPLIVTGTGPAPIIRPDTISTIGGLQQLYRQKFLLPAQTVVGMTIDNATFTSTLSLDQINASFMNTLQPYDVIAVQPPPGSYTPDVNDAFELTNTINGQTVYDPTTSGVIRSGHTESVAPLNLALAAGDMLDALYAFDYVVNLPIPSPSADGLLGRSTVGTNTTAIPTDRLYFDYSLVQNGVPFNRADNFDRFTVGIEKIIGHGEFSVEMRFPFAASMNGQFILENGRGSNETKFGNALVVLKHELGSNEQMVISGGLAISLPTGSDVEVVSAAGKSLIRLRNESIHLKPFLAMAFVPDQHFFMSAFAEYDVPIDGNQAEVNVDGTGLRGVGRFRDTSHILAACPDSCCAA